MPVDANEPVPTAPDSLARLGFRLVRLLCLLAWRRAVRVLTVGDCQVH